MTYEQLNTAIEAAVTDISLDFYHSERDHQNEFRGTFPVGILDPTVTTFPDNRLAVTPIYHVNIGFVDLIESGMSNSEKITIVQNMWVKAREFIARMENGNEMEPLEGKVITPFMTFPWNAHLTAGVLLTFNFETEDVYNYCEDTIPISYGIGTFIVS